MLNPWITLRLLLLLVAHHTLGLQPAPRNGKLYPEFGLMLKQQGTILASSDSIYLSLAVPLPSAKDLPNTKIEDVSCGEFSLNFRKAIEDMPNSPHDTSSILVFGRSLALGSGTASDR